MPNQSAPQSAKQDPRFGARQRMTYEERCARNLELLQQYNSQIIVPRSSEVRLMIRMVYPLNKAVAKLRRLVGMPLTVSEVLRALEPLKAWQEQATAWLRASGGDFILTADILGNSAAERSELVRHRDAHVIVPNADEAKHVVETLIRMDKVLVMLRLVSLETIENDGRLKDALELVERLDWAVGQLCQSTRMDYQSPKRKGRRGAVSSGPGAAGPAQPVAGQAVQPVGADKEQREIGARY